MASPRKKKQGANRRSSRRPQSGGHGASPFVKVDIPREIEHITRLAQEQDARIVSLGSFVLFSTDTGDAWLLDCEDSLALQVCQDGTPLPVEVGDTPGNFSIRWTARFALDGDAFVVLEDSGRLRTILGYPMAHIAAACERAAEGRRLKRGVAVSGVQVLRGEAIYFGVVFGIGFVLGPFRVLLLEPRVGDRAAQLIEAPVMAAAILLAGRWVGRRFCRCGRSGSSLAVGLLAVGFVLTADVGVGVLLRDMTFAEVFTNRDPVAGVVYYALLGLCAIAPWLFAARTS